MLIKNALHFFFYYISILVLFLAAKDECIFLEWGNIQTWSSDLIQYALGFTPDRGDIPCVSMFYFRHVIFIQRALDSHCLAAREIPAKSYFIVHNFTQMPQIFTVLKPPPHTYFSSWRVIQWKHKVQSHPLHIPFSFWRTVSLRTE